MFGSDNETMTVSLPLTHIYHPSLRIHNHANTHQGMHQMSVPDFGGQIGNKMFKCLNGLTANKLCENN